MVAPPCPSLEANKSNQVQLVPISIIEELVHIADFATNGLIEPIPQATIEAIAIKEIALIIDEELIIGREIERFIRNGRLGNRHIEGQEITESQTEVLLHKALFEAIAMLKFESPKGLFGNKLLVDSMLFHIDLFRLPIQVILTKNVAVAKQQVIISGAEVTTYPRSEQELFQVTHRVVVPILDFVVPIPLIVNLFIPEVDNPIAQITILAGARKRKKAYQE